MRCLKVILSAITILPALVSAARVERLEDFQEGSNCDVNEVISFKNFVGVPIGSNDAVRLFSSLTPVDNLNGGGSRQNYAFFDLKICMTNASSLRAQPSWLQR
jgi:hypothetical protein